MASDPIVSAVLIFYNEEKFIAEAIESVLQQTFEAWELLLVDDGSTDASTELALRHARCHPERIKYLHHDRHENRGPSASRNLGAKNARGEYIAFLDGDDKWFSHKLAAQVAILDQNPDVGMVCGSSEYWRSWTGHPDDCDEILRVGAPSDTVVEPPRLLVLLYPLGNGTAPSLSGLIVRETVVEQVGGFEEDFRDMYEDQAFLAKVYLQARVFVAGSCWDRYRLHEDSAVATAKRAGTYHAIRRSFLLWLERYLTKEGVRDAEVWKALGKATWPYRHPVLHKLIMLISLFRQSLLGKASRWIRSVGADGGGSN